MESRQRPSDRPPSSREAAPSTGLAEALHDTSNALTVVLGWLEEAGRDGQDEAFVRRAIEVAARKAREARALAREAIGAAPPREQPRPAADVLHEVVEALAIEADRAGVTLRLELSPDVPPVAFAVPLVHGVTNLVLNALSFCARGATVLVAGQGLVASQGRRELLVHVVDQGPGVAPELADTLFSGGTKRVGGAGIGLRHARHTARRLGGDLRLLDAAEAAHASIPGKDVLGERLGACFELRLPSAAALSELPRSPGTSQTLRSPVLGTRVLVVEDDRAVCALLDAGLGARGCDVVSVHDDHTLRERLPGLGPIDAVLLDLSPIAADIEGAVATIRATLPDAGIVFISGSSTIAAAQIADVTPRTRWVRKPFELAEITAAITELLPPKG